MSIGKLAYVREASSSLDGRYSGEGYISSHNAVHLLYVEHKSKSICYLILSFSSSVLCVDLLHY